MEIMRMKIMLLHKYEHLLSKLLQLAAYDMIMLVIHEEALSLTVSDCELAMQTTRDILVIVVPERMNDKKSIANSVFGEKMCTIYVCFT